MRYKLPDESISKLIQSPVRIADETNDIASVSDDVRFATAVAAYGQLLRGGRYTGDFSYDDIIRLAQQSRGSDLFGYRSEFINLVRLAKSADALQSR